MQLKTIITKRQYETHNSNHLVYEWENDFLHLSSCAFFYEKKIFSYVATRRFNYLRYLLLPNTLSFVFEMIPTIIRRRYNKPNIIPCIIDFFLTEKELKGFEKEYSKNPIVLISSKEAYTFLQQHNCKLPIAHFPLSISDRIINNSKIKWKQRKYDIGYLGRPNPVLLNYLNILSDKHKDISYFYGTHDSKGKIGYIDNTGEFFTCESRKEYLHLMQSCRIGLYATSGMDKDRLDTNGFHHVTPRFLEYLSCGCHVVCRWEDNPDTEFFGLNKFASNITSYEIFSNEIFQKLSSPPDESMQENYVRQHSTSKRFEDLSMLIDSKQRS